MHFILVHLLHSSSFFPYFSIFHLSCTCILILFGKIKNYFWIHKHALLLCHSRPVKLTKPSQWLSEFLHFGQHWVFWVLKNVLSTPWWFSTCLHLWDFWDERAKPQLCAKHVLESHVSILNFGFFCVECSCMGLVRSLVLSPTIFRITCMGLARVTH